MLNGKSETEFSNAVRSLRFKQLVKDSVVIPSALLSPDHRDTAPRSSRSIEPNHQIKDPRLKTRTSLSSDQTSAGAYITPGFGVALPQAFTTHRVFFGTDRRAASSSPGVHFGDERNDGGITYGIAEITIPHSHKEGNLERPGRRFVFFRSDENPDRHIVIHNVSTSNVTDWINSAKACCSFMGLTSRLPKHYGGRPRFATTSSSRGANFATHGHRAAEFCDTLQTRRRLIGLPHTYVSSC